MKITALALALLFAAAPAWAKNFAVPEKNPAITVTIPDTWKTDEIEYGYSAFSPGDDVYFSIETAGEKTVDAMMKNNTTWMKENKIVPTSDVQKIERDFNGLKGTVYHRTAKDDNGDTNIDFAIIPIANNRIVFLTIWASEEEYKAHAAEFDGIIASLKPIN